MVKMWLRLSLVVIAETLWTPVRLLGLIFLPLWMVYLHVRYEFTYEELGEIAMESFAEAMRDTLGLIQYGISYFTEEEEL